MLDAKDAERSDATRSPTSALLLRASGTPGITAVSGKASGFSIRSADLGRKPLVVAAEGDRIAIGYGLPAAPQALAADVGRDPRRRPRPTRKRVGALGDTPISGFVDGPAALQLASSAAPGGEQYEASKKPSPTWTRSTSSAIGSGTTGDLSTAKLIVGLTK